MYPKISLEIGSAQLSIALINLFSDILAQSPKIWWKRPCFIIKPNGSRKSFYYFFKDTPYPNYSKPLCVYVCTIIIHIICEWRAEAHRGGGRQSTAVKRKKWGRVLTLFIHRPNGSGDIAMSLASVRRSVNIFVPAL